MEIDSLKQHLQDLRRKITVYVPSKNDALDKQLAEFINTNASEHLKMLFLRQAEGVYLFGSKKVSLKLEKGDIKVRVGGGYLGLEEFVQQHADVEIEKLDRA